MAELDLCGVCSGGARKKFWGWVRRKKMMKGKMIEKLRRGRRAEMGGGGVSIVLFVVSGEGDERDGVGVILGLGLGFSVRERKEKRR